MAGVPIFIEVEETRNQADSRLCCKVVDLLFEKHIAPVGLVGTVEDTSALLQETRSHGLSPAIFVINTLGARPILPGLDILIGELPVLYFRRRLFAGKSGLMDQLLVGGQDVLQTSTVLGKLTPRLTSMWFYGTKNLSLIHI